MAHPSKMADGASFILFFKQQFMQPFPHPENLICTKNFPRAEMNRIMYLKMCNSFMTETVIIYEPVH